MIVNSYKPMIPKEAEDGGIEHVTLNAVLTKGVSQYAVYLGVGSDEFVAKQGKKLTYKEALTYYPHLKEEEYRK